MGLFSKKDKELDAVANQIQVDISNNYKSSALENIKWLEDLIEDIYITAGILERCGLVIICVPGDRHHPIELMHT